MTVSRALKILGGVGAGIAAAYFLDPNKGAERRSALKEKATSLTNDAREALAHKMAEFKETASGYAHEAKALIGSGEQKSQAGFTPSVSEGTAKRVH